MDVLVTTQARCVLTPDGALWAPLAAFEYQFWQRYLDIFREVRLVARCRRAAEAPPGWMRADGPRVRPVLVPDFHNPWQLLKHRGEVRSAVCAAMDEGVAVVLRLPCILGETVSSVLPSGWPFGVELVGDCYDSLSPRSYPHPAARFYRWWMVRRVRTQCTRACGVAYVNRTTLMERYPPGKETHTANYSSIVMRSEAFVEQSHEFNNCVRRWRLITVGSLQWLTKGPHILIDAVAEMVQHGWNLELVIVGDGKLRSQFEEQAAQRGLADRVRFTGLLISPADVRNELDQADLFVLPSLQEGLPRALIEAMARGLPCVASTIGGIPELLPAEEMVPPGDVNALAAKLEEVLSDPERMNRMAARNLATSREFHEDVLRPRRNEFYEHVRACTERRLDARRGANGRRAFGNRTGDRAR